MSAASTPSTTHPRTAIPAAIHRSDGSPRNKILRLLPPLELAALVERSELVEIKSKQILFEPGDKLEDVHFPQDCVISLVTVMEDGDQVRELPDLRRLLHRYSEFVFETVAQSAACNRLHVIEQRCARWLLMSQDRVGRDSFDLTQEFLAEMLGVRRPGVTVAMGILEKAGLISHGRGNITVANRAGLEKASCECYRTIRVRQGKLIA